MHIRNSSFAIRNCCIVAEIEIKQALVAAYREFLLQSRDPDERAY